MPGNGNRVRSNVACASEPEGAAARNPSLRGQRLESTRPGWDAPGSGFFGLAQDGIAHIQPGTGSKR